MLAASPYTQRCLSKAIYANSRTQLARSSRPLHSSSRPKAFGPAKSGRAAAAAGAGASTVLGLLGLKLSTTSSDSTPAVGSSPNTSDRLPSNWAGKTTPPRLVAPVPVLDLQSATERLRAGEGTTHFALGHGCKTRTDYVQLASNPVCEDEFVHATGPGLDGRTWGYWGVYDGHAGWATSKTLRHSLIPYVSYATSLLSPATSPDQLMSALKSAFVKLDSEILQAGEAALASDVTAGKAHGVADLAAATAGSCALLSMYDADDSKLRVACVGDSRAVLGRFDESSQSYAAEAMSHDQTGFNLSERERLAKEHPQEQLEDFLDPKTGRLLGIAVTRAFGDHRWKWSEDLIKQAREHWLATPPRPKYKNPPYMTAQPEIQECQIRRSTEGHPDFLIMASDGLWDHISNDHAVECVSRWIHAKKAGEKLQTKPGMASPAFATPDGSELFLHKDGEHTQWQASRETMVVEDDNAATHLVRNAFGGSRRELFCFVVGAPHPVSRDVRDDVTVQVIFFGDV